MHIYLKYILICFFILNITSIQAQFTDTTSLKIRTRLSFYSYEKEGEILLEMPKALAGMGSEIIIKYGDKITGRWEGKPSGNITSVKFNVNYCRGTDRITAEVKRTNPAEIKYVASCDLVILDHKPNEVKIDRLTGGLIVNDLPFFPFGFYCYSPVHPTLPEEEAVKGFNMISPYQNILPETINERKAFMDRCAGLGMKVHYNLLSVTGGGGVYRGRKDLKADEKMKLLMNEIKTFMDHPALLAWYIADEPDGNSVRQDSIENIYRLIKAADPWHPVSVVFMAPFLSSAKKYSNGLDIVMADPYPIPVYPVTMTGETASALKNEFNGKKPVWMVPQAFGGGEHWKREPTINEIRSMTWQSIIRGATGIQYFIRQGLNSFPKSTAVWNECGRMAVEVSTMVPWLLSDEEIIPVRTPLKSVFVTSRTHKGQVIIMAVNTVNEPVRTSFTLNKNYTGKAAVMFENRKVAVNGGTINDFLPAYGTQFYKINLSALPEETKPWKGNLLTDPGFEDLTSPGIPSACYARPGKDRGATYFLDSRSSIEGNYSLRLITPGQDNGITLRFFPVEVKSGNSYLVSIWAKSDPGQRLPAKVLMQKPEEIITPIIPQYVEAGIAGFGVGRFIPTPEWKQYVTIVTIPADTFPEIKANVILRMPGQGVAWFDLLQVIKDPLSKSK